VNLELARQPRGYGYRAQVRSNGVLPWERTWPRQLLAPFRKLARQPRGYGYRAQMRSNGVLPWERTWPRQLLAPVRKLARQLQVHGQKPSRPGALLRRISA